MAGLAGNTLTLVDWAKRLDPDGKIARLAELLSQKNAALEDAVFKEGNLPTGHRVSVRTGLPSVYWRLVNQGVTVSKSTAAQIEEGFGILEAWGEVDPELAKLNGNLAEFRMSENMAFIESMSQEFAQTLFYGNATTAPEEFNGFSMRYASLSAANGDNIINGGGSGSDNSSVWLVGWGPETVFVGYPKGSKAGLEHTDKGLQTIETTAGVGGGRLEVYQDKYVMKGGLVVKDWRYASRIANIDISALVAKSSAADIADKLMMAIERIPDFSGIRPVIYMNRSVRQMFNIQQRDDVGSGGGLTYENVDGKRVMSFQGIPVRLVDQLTIAEAAVS